MSRRSKWLCVVVGSVLTLTLLAHAQTVGILGRLVPTRGVGGLAVPTQSDFTYNGFWNIQANGSNSTYDQGLTVRQVSGAQRFLTIGLSGGNNLIVNEFSVVGQSYGATIAAPTNSWATPWGSPLPLGSLCANLWFDPTGNRLWTVQTINCLAYGSTTPTQVSIFTRTLNSDGSVSNVHGPVGLQGIVDRRAFGGCAYTPVSIQTAYSVPAFLCGWGNYTSVFAQNGLASLGGTAYFLPDPAGFGNNTEIPTGTFKVGMDHSSGSTSTDWYGAGMVTTSDRGIRATTDVQAYFDNGDPRPNPVCSGQTFAVNTSGTTVTDPGGNNCFQQWWAPSWWSGFSISPAYVVSINGTNYTVASVGANYSNTLTLTSSAGTQTGVTLIAPSTHPTPFFAATCCGGQWTGIAPDGFVRWTWGDGYWGAGFVIDTATRRGLLAVFTGCQGNCYYTSSTLIEDAFEYEFHAYDFTTLGQVVQGSLSAWKAQPAHMWSVALPNNVGGPVSPAIGTATGATFDATNKHVYVYVTTAHNPTTNRLYDFTCTTC